MRVVAGELRGRKIDAPQGEGTRPTVDRVREALFSSLYSLRGGFDEAVVLDAFAGSGALGIEAVSRGAASAVFYENDSKAVAACKRNLVRCGIDAPVFRRDVISAPPTAQRPPFDLVFLDPPYAYDPERVIAMMGVLREAGAVANDAICVYEHDVASRDIVSVAARRAGFEVRASKRYGKTGVTIMGGSA